MDDTPALPPERGDSRETVLLIGASSDIGLETIRRLANENVLILAHYHRSQAKLERLRQSLPGANIVLLPADLSRAGAVEQLLGVVRDGYSIPDKIVHLAAPKVSHIRFKDIAWEDFQRLLDVQLRSLVYVLREYLPAMAKKKKGKVVVVLSSYTLSVPPAALSYYVTVKYALLGLVRALAAEYSSRQLNINAISPSMVETAFLDNLDPRMIELAAAQSPWQRNATPKDVAGAIRFLLSHDADYMTGANLPISGGTAF